VLIEGCTMVGWVSGAGRLGAEPDPDGGAKFIAGAGSGTEAGGTGGGRSLNIWAEPAAGSSNAIASASSGKSLPPRPHPPMPLPLEVIAMLFTENAANSSLREVPLGTGGKTRC